jgi:hypothetical protein
MTLPNAKETTPPTDTPGAVQTQTTPPVETKPADIAPDDYEQHFSDAVDAGGLTDLADTGQKPPDKTPETPAAQTEKPALTPGVASPDGANGEGEDAAIAQFQKIFLAQQEEINRLRGGQKAPAPIDDAKARAKAERQALIDKTYKDYPELKFLFTAMREDIAESLGQTIKPLEEQFNKTTLEHAVADHFKTVTSVHGDYDTITKSPAFASWIQNSQSSEVHRVAMEGTAWEVAGLLTLYKNATGVQTSAGAGAGVAGMGAGTRSAEDKKLLKGMVGVKTRSNAVGTSGAPDPNDYEAAFNEAAKLLNSVKGR